MAQQPIPRQRRTWWVSSVAAVVALLVFVAIVVWLDTSAQPALTGTGLILVGVLLALIPAAIWLVVFYSMDRLEPEPKQQVAKIFVIGLALAGTIGIPLTDQVFGVQTWLFRSGMTLVLGSFFVIGAVEAFIVYATVRFFIYDLPDFNERTDGMVYGTAAGVGYGTALNIQFILANGGAALSTGMVYMAEVALAHAAFGGVLGYFLGRAKLEREKLWWLPYGLLVTTVLSGVFNILRNLLEQGTIAIGAGSALPSLNSLILAGVLALGVALAVAYLIQRDINLTLTHKLPPAAPDAAIGDRQSNFATVGTFAGLMIVGTIISALMVNGTTSFNDGGFQGAYPSYFGKETKLTAPDVLRVSDTLGTGTQFIIQKFATDAGQDAKKVAATLAAGRGTDFTAYKVLEYGQATVAGKPALTERFAYVDPLNMAKAIPQVITGMDYIVVDGGQAVVVTMLTTPDDQASEEPLFISFVNRLTF